MFENFKEILKTLKSLKGIVGNLKNLIKALNNGLKLKVLFETWKFKLGKNLWIYLQGCL